MRAAFGKVNTLHTHVLPWADRPLVINNLVGGEEGISDAGVSVARLIPNRQRLLRSDRPGLPRRCAEGELFKSSKRGDLSYVGHLRGYHDITEVTNLDLGASYSHGHNAAGIVDDVDVGRFTTRAVRRRRHVPVAAAAARDLSPVRGADRVIWSRRDQFDGLQKAFGFYVSGDYQFARRWWIGGARSIDPTARTTRRCSIAASRSC